MGKLTAEKIKKALDFLHDNEVYVNTEPMKNKYKKATSRFIHSNKLKRSIFIYKDNLNKDEFDAREVILHQLNEMDNFCDPSYFLELFRCIIKTLQDDLSEIGKILIREIELIVESLEDYGVLNDNK